MDKPCIYLFLYLSLTIKNSIMIKGIYLVVITFVVTMFAVSCCSDEKGCAKEGEGSETEKTGDSIKQETGAVEMIDINKFWDVAADNLDKTVQLEGTVVHVCKHGGKRMHIIGEDTEQRLVVHAAEDMEPFKAEMEGNKVKITGIINETRIDEAYLVKWEEEIKAAQAEEAEAEEHPASHTSHDLHEHGAEGDDGKSHDPMTQIEDIRKQISENEKGYISKFSFNCTAVESL